MKFAAFLFGLLVTCVASIAHSSEVKNVVLVHGAFADGSGWKPVAGILEKGGYTVYVVQEPLTSFAGRNHNHEPMHVGRELAVWNDLVRVALNQNYSLAMDTWHILPSVPIHD